jgi:hypothetical protein
MADTPWGDFTDRSTMLGTDVLLVMDAGGGGVNVPGTALVRKNAAGQIEGDLYVGTGTGAGFASVYLNGVSASYMQGQRGGTAHWFLGDKAAAGGGDGLILYAYLGNPVVVHGSTLRPDDDGLTPLGSAPYRFSTVWASTGAFSTSDENEKTDIEAIPDAWLDAWSGVEWVRYKLKSSVEDKGDAARWHTGLIAQRVHAAFAAAGIDAFEIGLVGRDIWEEETRPVMAEVPKMRQVTKPVMVEAGEVNGATVYRLEQATVDEAYTEMEPTGEVEVVKAAGERWNLRYDECFAVAMALEARERATLADRLAALEAA